MRKIVITGGTGFVGRSVCERLFAHDAGCRLVVPTRHLATGRVLQTVPTVDLVECDVHDAKAVAAALAGADALVHLVAILHGDAESFARVHVHLPRTLAAACTAAGIKRVVHVSALGAGLQAPSNYLRSKAAGEAVWADWAKANGAALTILQPSVIFGAEDRFTNLFAKLQRLFPVMPLAGAGTRFQPVWVGDVAQAVVNSLFQPQHAPVIDCAGPEVLTLKQIVQRVGTMAGCQRPVLPVPERVGMLQAAVMGLMPGEPMMSRDNLLSMRVPNVASGTVPGLDSLGITPRGLDSLAEHFQPANPRQRS